MYREVHLGQELYFVLWDDDTDQAGVARGEVVQYASDYSKVQVRVVEAPQRTVIGRTTWILPDRLDDDERTARRHYQQRARQELRAADAEAETAKADPREGAVVEAAVAGPWSRVAEGWADVALLVDSIDFESGWPDNQSRLAKFATLRVLQLLPAITALLDALPRSDAVEVVRESLRTGAVGAAARVCGDDPFSLLERWDELPLEEVASAADDLTGIASALEEIADNQGLAPGLAGR